MSMFSGKQEKGAMRVYREKKRQEAGLRQQQPQTTCEIDQTRHSAQRCGEHHETLLRRVFGKAS